MTENNYIILILICLAVLLVAVPVVSAKEVTAKVDDKGLMVYRYGILGTLHTEYGTIIVQDEDYNNIQINDTINYNTDKDTFLDIYWKVKRLINELVM